MAFFTYSVAIFYSFVLLFLAHHVGELLLAEVAVAVGVVGGERGVDLGLGESPARESGHFTLGDDAVAIRVVRQKRVLRLLRRSALRRTLCLVVVINEPDKEQLTLTR